MVCITGVTEDVSAGGGNDVVDTTRAGRASFTQLDDGEDRFIGGRRADDVRGGPGADQVDTGAGADSFSYDDGDTAELGPGAKRHLEMVAMRLEHVPFPIVIEQSQHNAKPQLDAARRQTIVMHLNRMGITGADERVVVAGAFAEGYTGIEAERAYYGGVLNGGFNGGAGRRFGGTGGVYR